MTGRNAKAIVSAIVSAVIAFLSSLLTALQGQESGFDTVTAGQWVTAILAFFVGLGAAGGATYRTNNNGAPSSATDSVPPATGMEPTRPGPSQP